MALSAARRPEARARARPGSAGCTSESRVAGHRRPGRRWSRRAPRRARGSRARARRHAGGKGRLRKREPAGVAPRQLDGARDPDARRRDDLDRLVRARAQLERRPVERRPSCSPVTPSAWHRRPGPRPAGAGLRALGAPASLDALRRLERADQHGARDAFRLAHEVQAPVDPVRAVDVRVPGGPNIDAFRAVRPP